MRSSQSQNNCGADLVEYALFAGLLSVAVSLIFPVLERFILNLVGLAIPIAG
jgi:hypothetical protein